MNRNHTLRSGKHGSAQTKLLVLAAVLIAIYMFKPAGASLEGKMDYELVANYGEPISQRTVSRPR